MLHLISISTYPHGDPPTQNMASIRGAPLRIARWALRNNSNCNRGVVRLPCPISSPHSHATSSTTSNSQRRSRRHLSVMVPSAKKVSTGSGGSGTADELLRGVPKDHVATVQKVVDRARRAADQWSVEVTDFLEPPVGRCKLTSG